MEFGAAALPWRCRGGAVATPRRCHGGVRPLPSQVLDGEYVADDAAELPGASERASGCRRAAAQTSPARGVDLTCARRAGLVDEERGDEGGRGFIVVATVATVPMLTEPRRTTFAIAMKSRMISVGFR